LQSAREAAYIRMADLDHGTVKKFPGSDGLFAPRWSPDGKLVIALERDGQRRMMIYRFGEDVWRPLTESRADFPNWSRDSKNILFRAGDVLRELNVDNGHNEKVLELKNEEIGGHMHAIGRSYDGGRTRTLNRDSRQIYELYFQRP
jgi:Tol biopolymer transport system component